jgi:hypothetical protein
VAKKSGKAFEKHYNGSSKSSSSSSGDSAGKWKKSGDTWVKRDKGHTYLSKNNESNTQRNNDHIHYWNNHETAHEHHKKEYQVGERLSSVKGKSTASNSLFDGIKYFLGLD